MFGRVSERILFSPEYLSLLIVQFELIKIFAYTVSVVVEYSQVVTGSGMTLVTPSRKKGDGRGVVLFNSHTCRQGVSRLTWVILVDGGIKVIWGNVGIKVIWEEMCVSRLFRERSGERCVYQGYLERWGYQGYLEGVSRLSRDMGVLR